MLLPSITFGQTPKFLKPLLKINQDTWNSGDVCRHAAANLVKHANSMGYRYRVPMFGQNDTSDGDEGSSEGHTIFVLEYNNEFYAIDSVRSNTGDYKAIYKKFNKYDPEDIEAYADFTLRDLSVYEGEAGPEMIDCWLNSDDCTQNILWDIDVQLDSLMKNKELVRKLEEAYQPVFEWFGIDYEAAKKRAKETLQRESKR